MIRPTKSIWLLWILATCISSVIGSAVATILIQFFDDNELALSVSAFLFTWGLMIGIGQWMILRTKLTKAWGWIPATAIGLPLGLFLGYVASIFGLPLNNENDMLVIILISTIGGIITGALQWLALPQKVKRSPQWILVSAVSWGVGITAFFYIFSLMSYVDFTYLIILFNLLIGGFVGTIGGAFVESSLIHTESRNIDLPNHAS